ncbi:hypothetical protein COOONC_06628 [Cooperia oncophora]
MFFMVIIFVFQSRHQLEIDQADLKSQNNELIANNAALTAMKRKVENDVQIARNELDECLNELKASEERSRKAAADADRLAEEVRQEQEHAAHVERQRKGLELTAKELQAKIEEAERAMLQFGQKALSKVEEKVRQASAQYHAEVRRHQEALKGLTKQDRRSRELQFQVKLAFLLGSATFPTYLSCHLRFFIAGTHKSLCLPYWCGPAPSP